MTKIKKIGLIGFGVVGEGVYHVINNTPSLHSTIKKIGIKHIDKKRNAPQELFTSDVESILSDTEIDTIVELIDDAETAYEIVKNALQNKKNVVTANKKMLAYHLPELIKIQRENNVSLLYEAAVCGSIPILRNLEEYYNNDLLQSIKGIVNGSTNFILTQMSEKNISFNQALAKAQELGFAESNPALDVEGFDAQNKLTLLLKHTFGIEINPGKIFRKGITSVTNEDIQYAKEKNLAIKLLAKAYYNEAQEIVAYVIPQFVSKESQLSHVNNEYNGVLIGSLLADEQFLYGKGAGRYPTASAVLSDISALNYAYKYEYKKSGLGNNAALCNTEILSVYISWKNNSHIDKDLFEEISTEYASENNKYLIGKIRIENLHKISLLHEVSIVEMPDEINQKTELTPLAVGKGARNRKAVSY